MSLPADDLPSPREAFHATLDLVSEVAVAGRQGLLASRCWRYAESARLFQRQAADSGRSSRGKSLSRNGLDSRCLLKLTC